MVTKYFNTSFLSIILIGLIIRVLISAFTYHPDVRIVNFSSAIFLKEFNFNPYSFNQQLSPNDPRQNIYQSEVPDDLPLQYLVKLPFELTIRPLINSEVENRFLVDPQNLFGNVEIFKHLALIKFPLIIFDLLVGIFLYLIVKNDFKKKVLILWMFNPMTLWATSAIGQVDIIPTFFLVLSYYLLLKSKVYPAAFALGIGAAIKSFPFLLAPFLIWQVRNWYHRLITTLLIISPVIISVLPYLGSREFRANALFAPQLDKIFYSKISISGGEAIYINLVILVVLYLIYFLKERTPKDFLYFSTIALILVLAFTHFHIQWFLWIMPFLLILILNGLNLSSKISIWGISFSIVLMLCLFESSLQIGLLSPLFPELSKTTGLVELLGKNQADFIRNLAATIFTGCALFFAIQLIKKNEN